MMMNDVMKEEVMWAIIVQSSVRIDKPTFRELHYLKITCAWANAVLQYLPKQELLLLLLQL